MCTPFSLRMPVCTYDIKMLDKLTSAIELTLTLVFFFRFIKSQVFIFIYYGTPSLNVSVFVFENLLYHLSYL